MTGGRELVAWGWGGESGEVRAQVVDRQGREGRGAERGGGWGSRGDETTGVLGAEEVGSWAARGGPSAGGDPGAGAGHPRGDP